MRYCIIMGSPRKSGNTISILEPFMDESAACGVKHDLVWLYDKQIKPCIACRKCQTNKTEFGCWYQDDVQSIFDKVLACDLIVLATPIYSWYCTPPMKALIDRLVYGMNKYYGDEKGPALWEGKKLALVTTCGYRPEAGADLWESGVKRYCKHSKLQYLGMLAERDLGYNAVFMDKEKEQRARTFAREIYLKSNI